MYASQFDSLATIDRQNWATTMLRAGKKNHAELLIEGVNEDNKYFATLVHLVTPAIYAAYTSHQSVNGGCSYGFQKIGRPEIKQLTEKDPQTQEYKTKSVKYRAHSETWIRPAWKVKNLINEALKERDDPLANPVTFNLLGSSSIFAFPVKAWVIDHPILQEAFIIKHKDLKSDYNFAHYHSSKIASSPDPKVDFCLAPKVGEVFRSKLMGFTFLGSLGKAVVSPTKDNINQLHEIVQMVGSSNLSQFTEVANEIVQNISSRLAQVPQAQTTLASEFLNFRSTLESDAEKAYWDFCRLILDHMKVEKIDPDNCFTWARAKLRLIDVDIQDNNFAFLASVTKLYTS